MENLIFIQPVTIKLFVRRDDNRVNRPYTTLHITTAKGFILALIDYKIDRVVYNSDKSDIRFISYTHKVLANNYAIVKF